MLMAALTVAPTPLGPTHAAVIQDTVWLPTGTRVKVIKSVVSNIGSLIPRRSVQKAGWAWGQGYYNIIMHILISLRVDKREKS